MRLDVLLPGDADRPGLEAALGDPEGLLDLPEAPIGLDNGVVAHVRLGGGDAVVVVAGLVRSQAAVVELERGGGLERELAPEEVALPVLPGVLLGAGVDDALGHQQPHDGIGVEGEPLCLKWLRTTCSTPGAPQTASSTAEPMFLRAALRLSIFCWGGSRSARSAARPSPRRWPRRTPA